ncbi:hypothetical protein P43SY_004964 [Pythium insidiosum]|uniref:Spen paralogue and orthologue SPOC C-terminal domain-containing protein n=1 Tax=Pythium insidiosum TaxID=114742 RepID=A0AAD5Q9I3_PYTIN|nr:hypothetical protein P43SY_004964 [Pythium insidiosum]
MDERPAAASPVHVASADAAMAPPPAASDDQPTAAPCDGSVPASKLSPLRGDGVAEVSGPPMSPVKPAPVNGQSTDTNSFCGTPATAQATPPPPAPTDDVNADANSERERESGEVSPDDNAEGDAMQPSLPRQRSSVYERYMTMRGGSVPESNNSSNNNNNSGSETKPAHVVNEITNSNDDVEKAAGEVVSVDPACADQENDPQRANCSLTCAADVVDLTASDGETNRRQLATGRQHDDWQRWSPRRDGDFHGGRGGGRDGWRPNEGFRQDGPPSPRGRPMSPGRDGPPPFDGRGRGGGRGERGRSRSRSRSRGRDGPPMMNGNGFRPHGPDQFHNNNNGGRGGGRKPPQQRYAPPHSPRKPVDFQMNHGGPERGRSRSPQRNGFGGGPPPFRGGSPGRGPMHHHHGHPGSPGRGPPPGHFDDRGYHDPRMMNGRFSPRREPPNDGFRGGGPPPEHFQRGPPRGRSRSRSPPRKRDRSWERQGPSPGPMHHDMPPPRDMYMGPPPMQMTPRPMAGPPPSVYTVSGGEWQFELKRSGRFKCRCRGIPTNLPARCQLPLSLDVVQLPRMELFREFLMLDRQNLQRLVYELRPDSADDRMGYDEYRDYLLRGRNGVARAGAASELETKGYKIFILPPGVAARALGYKYDMMIAVLRQRP